MTTLDALCPHCCMTRDERLTYPDGCPLRIPSMGCPIDRKTNDIPEGRGSSPAGALVSGSPHDVARDAKLGGAAPGGVAWPCEHCSTASMCKLNGICLYAANRCTGDKHE